MASIRVRRRPDGTRAFQVRGRGIKTRSFERRADAQLYKAEQERRALLGSLYVAAPETFGAELDGLLSRKEAEGLKASTMKRKREVARLLAPLRSRPLPELRRAQVEDLIAEVALRAPRQAQQAHGLVKQALRAARARGQTVDDAILEMRPPRYESREPRFLTLDELYELAARIPDGQRRIVTVAGLTGMRQGELFSLLDADVDLAGKVVWVGRGKTRAARRRVYLSDEAASLFREQLLVRPNRGVGQPAGTSSAPGTGELVRPGSHFVFPAPSGERWNKDNFMHRYFRPAAVAASLGTFVQLENGRRHYEGIVFHSLRHTAISLMALAGWRFEHVAEQVGWAAGTWTTMYARYRHLFAGEMQAQAAKLDELVRGAQA
jgi:integrase